MLSMLLSLSSTFTPVYMPSTCQYLTVCSMPSFIASFGCVSDFHTCGL